MDVDIVLDFLDNLGDSKNLPLEVLSKKLVALIALTSAHRAQTISLIKVINIRKNSRGLEIHIPDLIKTSAPGKAQPVIFLPTCDLRPNLCLVSCLNTYLEVTSPYRKGEDRLILANKIPFKPVSSQTISKWIKSILGEAGIDTQVFSGHSTRHAATSSAFNRGVDLETIKNTAGWSNRSKVFLSL